MSERGGMERLNLHTILATICLCCLGMDSWATRRAQVVRGKLLRLVRCVGAINAKVGMISNPPIENAGTCSVANSGPKVPDLV
jgi:hypothetical protein